MTFDALSTPDFLSPTIDIPYHDAKKMAEIIDIRERRTASVVNNKESGMYPLGEFVNAQQWFTAGNPRIFRDGFRAVFVVPAIAPGATQPIPHGQTIVNMTNYWAAVTTDQPDFRIVPYASVTGFTSQIEMRVDSMNIYIINGGASPAITGGLAVIEYLKT